MKVPTCILELIWPIIAFYSYLNKYNIHRLAYFHILNAKWQVLNIGAFFQVFAENIYLRNVYTDYK